MITGEETNPEVWNDSAAAFLSEMVAKLRECSGAMDFVPRPTGFKPGLGYLVKQAYGAFKTISATTKDPCILYALLRRDRLNVKFK